LPAAITSSENSRLFSSEGFGPNHGPCHSGCLYVYLLVTKIERQTNGRWSKTFGRNVNLCDMKSVVGILLTVLPRAKMVVVIWEISFFSHRSTVWKTSSSVTPYAMMAFWNLIREKIVFIRHWKSVWSTIIFLLLDILH
jgi:hypothetical protein